MSAVRCRRLPEVDLCGLGGIVKGPGSRDIVLDVTGRLPAWSSARRGPRVQQRTDRAVVASVELRYCDSIVTSSRESSLPRKRMAAQAELQYLAEGLR